MSFLWLSVYVDAEKLIFYSLTIKNVDDYNAIVIIRDDRYFEIASPALPQIKRLCSISITFVFPSSKRWSNLY